MEPYVLLVEADARDVDSTRRALKENHIANELVVLGDGAAACEYLFGARPERGLPALILLSSKLPAVSGLEVYERIAADERTRGIATIILTSGKPEEDLLENRFPGRRGYVRKPVDFGEFVPAARAAGLEWLLVPKSAADS
ncbi:MAG TPA: response regulator [Candidatus Tumulicola sp.]|nr:response regulator [Candidatus Tumulicola sp.]